jgi:uncharacterized protein YegP (UPF0339 family)
MATKTPVIEIYRDPAGDWRWRLQARNGEVLASGEGYKTQAGAQRGAVAFKRNAAAAVVVLT